MQDPFRYSAQSIPAFIWQLIWYNTLWSDWVTRVDSSDFDAIISKTLLVLEALAFGLIEIVPIHSRVLHGSAFTWLNASLDYVSREEALRSTHWWLIRYTISLYIPCLSLSLEETTKNSSSSSNAIADLICKEHGEIAAILLLPKVKKAERCTICRDLSCERLRLRSGGKIARNDAIVVVVVHTEGRRRIDAWGSIKADVSKERCVYLQSSVYIEHCSRQPSSFIQTRSSACVPHSPPRLRLALLRLVFTFNIPHTLFIHICTYITSFKGRRCHGNQNSPAVEQ